MTALAIMDLLAAHLADLDLESQGTSLYLFGSALADAASAEDIDLLAVYGANVDSVALRVRMLTLCLRLPIHLLLMSREEEKELDFISKQQCIPVTTAETEPHNSGLRLASARNV
jgi:hypothetical protein